MTISNRKNGFVSSVLAFFSLYLQSTLLLLVVILVKKKARSDEGYITHADLENQLLNAVEFNYDGEFGIPLLVVVVVIQRDRVKSKL